MMMVVINDRDDDDDDGHRSTFDVNGQSNWLQGTSVSPHPTRPATLRGRYKPR